LAEDYYNFIPRTAPILQVYTMWDTASREVPGEIYRFPDAESFMRALRKAHSRPYWAVWNAGGAFDTGPLEKTASLDCTITRRNTDHYWSSKYLVLPSSLEAGYYLV